MKAAIIEPVNNGQFFVKGKVSFVTVVKLRKIGDEFIRRKNTKLIFDLRNVIVEDSSCLSLLICWMRTARNLGKLINFVNLPKQLITMAKLTGLDNVWDFL